MTSDMYVKNISQEEDKERTEAEELEDLINKGKQKFLATSRRIMSFSNHREPSPFDKVVYIDGDFDMMHNGHVEILRKAKEMGTFLYVGIYDDVIPRKQKGNNFPILSLNERVLMVLANKYVDDVIIGAPYEITADLIKTFNISVVV